jgi:hypothetical protein
MSLLRLIFSVVLAGALNCVHAADIGFDWIWPPPFGLNPLTASVAPCGGFNASSSLVTHYLDQLRWNQTEAEIKFMTRISTQANEAETPTNWTELYPAIEADLDQQNANLNGNATATNNPAQFCIHIDEPPGFNLNSTIFQLIANTPAGIIFAVRTHCS